jgi:hypothetical protein
MKPNNKKINWGSKFQNNYKPGELCSLDFIELYKQPISSNFGVNYVLVACDVVSNKVYAYFSEKMTTRFVIYSLLNYLSLNVQTKCIWSDSAAVFKSKQMKKFLAYFNITHLDSAPFKPQSHGQIEAKVRLIRQMMSTLSGGGEDAILYAPVAVHIINNWKRLNHKFSANDMHFYACKSNFDEFEFLSSLMSKDMKNSKQIKQTVLNELKRLKELDQISLEKRNKHRGPHKIRLNDLVLVKTFNSNKDKNKYSLIPHVVTIARKYVITAQNVMTKQIVRRHAKDVKILDLELKKLPDLLKNEIYTQEMVKSFENPIAVAPKRRKYNLRRKTNELQEEEDTFLSEDELFVDFDE